MAREDMDRRLAAILSADVVGYSRLMGIDETGTLGAFRAHRAELIDPTIAEHNGRIVKLMGDGLLLEFASTIDAVECAIAIQNGMAVRNASVPDDHRIVFRIAEGVGIVALAKRAVGVFLDHRAEDVGHGDHRARAIVVVVAVGRAADHHHRAVDAQAGDVAGLELVGAVVLGDHRGAGVDELGDRAVHVLLAAPALRIVGIVGQVLGRGGRDQLVFDIVEVAIGPVAGEVAVAVVGEDLANSTDDGSATELSISGPAYACGLTAKTTP